MKDDKCPTCGQKTEDRLFERLILTTIILTLLAVATAALKYIFI